MSVELEVKLEQVTGGYIITFGRAYYPAKPDIVVAASMEGVGVRISDRLSRLLDAEKEHEEEMDRAVAELQSTPPVDASAEKATVL
jgi:hypothetical protein